MKVKEQLVAWRRASGVAVVKGKGSWLEYRVQSTTRKGCLSRGAEGTRQYSPGLIRKKNPKMIMSTAQVREGEGEEPVVTMVTR